MISTTTKQYLDLLQQAEEATNRANAIKLINMSTLLLEQMRAANDSDSGDDSERVFARTKSPSQASIVTCLIEGLQGRQDYF